MGIYLLPFIKFPPLQSKVKGGSWPTSLQMFPQLWNPVGTRPSYTGRFLRCYTQKGPSEDKINATPSILGFATEKTFEIQL